MPSGSARLDRKFFTLLDWRVLEFSYTKDLSGDIPTKALSSAW